MQAAEQNMRQKEEEKTSMKGQTKMQEKEKGIMQQEVSLVNKPSALQEQKYVYIHRNIEWGS